MQEEGEVDAEVGGGGGGGGMVEVPIPQETQTQKTPEEKQNPTHFTIQNIWFTHTPTYGRFVWLDALISPACSDSQSKTCSTLEVPGVTLVWSVVVVVVVVVIAALETQDRWRRFYACVDAHTAPCVALSPWFFDFGHWTLLWFVTFYVARIVLIVQHRDDTRVKLREDRGPPSLVAKIAWFAHVVSVPGTIAAGLLYALFSRDGELHGPLTDASYILNAVFAVLDVWFFRMVLLYAHVVWVVATAAVYAVLMLPRSYHNPIELVVACVVLGVVYTVIADFSMMRDTFYRNHAFV